MGTSSKVGNQTTVTVRRMLLERVACPEEGLYDLRIREGTRLFLFATLGIFSVSVGILIKNDKEELEIPISLSSIPRIVDGKRLTKGDYRKKIKQMLETVRISYSCAATPWKTDFYLDDPGNSFIQPTKGHASSLKEELREFMRFSFPNQPFSDQEYY